MPSSSLRECWRWHHISPISHTMVESGSAGPALAKARNDDSGKKKKRWQAICFASLNLLGLKHQPKRECSSNHANQKAPQTCAIALKAPVAFFRADIASRNSAAS